MGGIQCAKCFVVVFIDCGLICVANACKQRCVYKVKEEDTAVENSDIDNSSETMILILTPFWSVGKAPENQVENRREQAVLPGNNSSPGS